MPYHVHAVIERADGTKLSRGDSLTSKEAKDLPGFDELLEGGALSEKAYDPAADESPAPEVIEVDGVKYVQVSDGAEATDVRA